MCKNVVVYVPESVDQEECQQVLDYPRFHGSKSVGYYKRKWAPLKTRQIAYGKGVP